MIALRLFAVDDPFQQKDCRFLSSGEVAIGRDPSADWVMEDGACELSRRHCVIGVRNGGVWLRDTSANGVYLGAERARVQRDCEVPLSAAQSIYLGPYLIVVDVMDADAQADADTQLDALDAPFHSPILRGATIDASAVTVPAAWADEAAAQKPPAAQPAAELLEAFCAGAGLDASYFAGEDAAAVLHRAGAMYRQTVLGVADLMSDRTSTKSAYQLDRTTVSGAGNNPFKWAEPHRLAIDLLRPRHAGFLAGEGALKASFEDLKTHLLCVLAGSRAALAATLKELSPAEVEAAAARPAALAGKAKACWSEYVARHARFAAQAAESVESCANVAFRQGYERQLRQLAEGEARQ
jgi:predicted component of type VI protein secretion system